MVGVLVKNGSTVIEKQVFGGDVSNVPVWAAAYQAKHPNVTVEIHVDTDPNWTTAFEQVTVPASLTPTQSGWLAAKGAGAAAALVFMAKYLGLE